MIIHFRFMMIVIDDVETNHYGDLKNDDGDADDDWWFWWWWPTWMCPASFLRRRNSFQSQALTECSWNSSCWDHPKNRCNLKVFKCFLKKMPSELAYFFCDMPKIQIEWVTVGWKLVKVGCLLHVDRRLHLTHFIFLNPGLSHFPGKAFHISINLHLCICEAPAQCSEGRDGLWKSRNC